MKLFYIDQSFFLETPKSIEMLTRFVQIISQEEVDVMLISGTETIFAKEIFQEFMALVEELDILTFISNTKIQLGAIDGELSEFGLVINGHSLQPMDGSYYCIELQDELKLSRIYLDIAYHDPKKNERRIMSRQDLEKMIKSQLAALFDSKKYS